MNNISSIIQSVQRDLGEMRQDRLREASDQIAQAKQPITDLTRQMSELRDKQTSTSSQKKKLKIQRRVYILEGWLKSLKALQKNNLKTGRDLANENSRTTKRMRSLLEDIDAATTNALSDSKEAADAPAPSSASSALNQASEAAIAAKHAQKAARSESENVKNLQQQNAIHQSVSAISKQLNALKKLKFIGAAFKILKPLIQVGVQALLAGATAGASIIFQGLINTCVSFLEYAISTQQQHRIESATQTEHNAQELSAQAESDLIAAQAQNEKSQAILQKALDQLQNAKAV